MTAPPDASDRNDPLRSTAIVQPAEYGTLTADVVNIGSGMGGSALAWARQHGRRYSQSPVRAA